MNQWKHTVEITPGDIYDTFSQENIRKQLRRGDLVVTEFRVPKPDEEYFGDLSGTVTIRQEPTWSVNEPRLIVKKRDPAPPVVGEFRVTVKDVYGVELVELLEIADRFGVEIIGFRVPIGNERWLAWYQRSREAGGVDNIGVSPETIRFGVDALGRETTDGYKHACGIRAIVREKQTVIGDPFA